MLERIVCPNCGSEFSLDINDARTNVVCDRCQAEFVYTSEAAPGGDDTVEISRESPKPKKEKERTSEEEIARPGMTIGNYEIIEEIGRGAVGVVYKARQKNLNRMVALKILLAGRAASEEDVRRFHHEALAVAKLRHPNIVPVYDVGVHEGKHYFAMEYVEGRPLHHVMKGKRLSPNEALEIILKVAAAISDAHKHGIIHRDVKPANIMVNEDGRVQVMDFGLAKEVEADVQFTRSGTTMGTPNYMPLEQAQGDNRNIDERSDIYSLGAVLYEMLTGVPPFVAETNLKTILKVINEEPIPPRRRNPQIHRDIETICTKAMEKEKSRRYGTVDEFMEDIKRFHAGEPILARPPSTIYRVSKKFRKHRAVIAGSLGTIAVIVILVSLWNLIFPPQPLPPGPGNGIISNGPGPGNGEVKPVEATKLPLYDDGEGRIPGELKDKFIKNAAGSDQFLAVPVNTDKLPEKLEVEMDLLLSPDASGVFDVCLYADTEDDYHAGFVLTFDIIAGVLQKVTFSSAGKRYGEPFEPSPPLRPKDGKLHLRLWRESRDVFVLLGELEEPHRFRATEASGLRPRHGEDVGLALYGRGINWENLRVWEIVPPCKELLNNAYMLYAARRYGDARARFKKFLAAYRGRPGIDIKEEEFVRAGLYEAMCLANEGGLYAGKCNRDVLEKAAGMFRRFIERYSDSFPDEVLTAEEYLLHIRLRSGEVDLTTEAVKLADRYEGLEASDVLQRAFLKLPARVIKKMFERDLANLKPEDVETFNQLANHYIAEEKPDDAAWTLEILSDYYLYHDQYDMALEELKRILGLDFGDSAGRVFREAAKIKQARIYLMSGDYDKYSYTNGELFHIYQEPIRRDDGTYVFKFDSLLGPHKVTWGRNSFERWLSSPPSERDNYDLWTARVKLNECLNYIEPVKPPMPENPDDAESLREWSEKMRLWQIEHLQWDLVILGAAAELVRVEYARGTSPAVITKLLEPFRKNPKLAEELRAELGTLLAEVLEHSKQYYRARQLCKEILENYSNLADSGIRAINIIIQTRLLEPSSLADISLDEIKKDLALMDRFADNTDPENAEARVDAMLKAAFARATQYIEQGRDEAGRETEKGVELRSDLEKIWAEMEEVMNDAGLSSDSYVRQMHQLINPHEPLTQDKIQAYDREMALQTDSYKKNEMKFTMALRLLLENDAASRQRAEELFKEIMEDDQLDEYWFTRFLKKYRKTQVKPPFSST